VNWHWSINTSGAPQLILLLRSAGIPCSSSGNTLAFTSRQWCIQKALFINTITTPNKTQNFKAKCLEARLKLPPCPLSYLCLEMWSPHLVKFTQRMKPAARRSWWMKTTVGQSEAPSPGRQEIWAELGGTYFPSLSRLLLLSHLTQSWWGNRNRLKYRQLNYNIGRVANRFLRILSGCHLLVSWLLVIFLWRWVRPVTSF
jgi:hypothetical protein